MKKIVITAAIALLPVVSAHAAQTNCSGTAGAGTAVSHATDGSLFVRSTFTPQCSNNTIVRTDQNATSIWGGAASQKGKNTFRGSSNGGAVRTNAECPSAGCTVTEVNTAMSAASS